MYRRYNLLFYSQFSCAMHVFFFLIYLFFFLHFQCIFWVMKMVWTICPCQLAQQDIVLIVCAHGTGQHIPSFLGEHCSGSSLNLRLLISFDNLFLNCSWLDWRCMWSWFFFVAKSSWVLTSCICVSNCSISPVLFTCSHSTHSVSNNFSEKVFAKNKSLSVVRIINKPVGAKFKTGK